MFRRIFHTSIKFYARYSTEKNPVDDIFVKFIKWGVTTITFGMLTIIFLPDFMETMKKRRRRKMSPKELEQEIFKENEKLAKKGELDCSPLLECLKSGQDCKELIQKYLYCIDKDLRPKI